MSKPAQQPAASNKLELNGEETQEPALNQGLISQIERHFAKSGSGKPVPLAQQKQQQEEEEEHTGITDDEDSGDEDAKYDVMSRHTLKARSEAMAEVIKEAKKLQLAEEKQGAGTGKNKP